MKRRIHFIVNPRSGDRKKEHLHGLIQKYLSVDLFDTTLTFTTHGGHASELAAQSVADGFDIVIAAGGDGTINEIASQLIGTDVTLGIIPYGSGNGFARHLGVHMNDEKAVAEIAQNTILRIDVGFVNGFPFFCTSGAGFDSLVGQRFEELPHRGLKGYIRTVWREIRAYKGLQIQWEQEGKQYSAPAFLFTAANAGQFGNNAWIAPHADIADGFLDFCLVKPFSLLKLPGLAWKMFRKKLPGSTYYQTFRATECKIQLPEIFPFHADGEIKGTSDVLHWTMKPASLNVLIPKKVIGIL